ncbi:hypothetical protein MBLNU459_g6393t1 [Dothideomycetes sp. NU459]
MIEWRDRGYVLDSDEEELTLSDGDTPPAKDTTHGKDSSEAGDREADKAEREFGALQDALSGPPPATGALALTSAEEPLPQRTSQTSATDVYDPDADIGKTCLELTDNGGQDAAHNGTAVRDTAQIETPGPHDSSGDSIYFIDAASTQRPSRPLRTYGRRGQPTVLQPSNNRAPDLPPAAQNYDPASSPLDLTTQPSQTSTIDSISGLPSHASHKTTDTTGQDPARDILDQRRASVSSSDLSDVDMDILSSSPGRLFFRTASSGEPATTSTTPGVEAQRLSFSPEAVPVAEQQYGLQQAMLNRHLTSLAAPLRTLRARKAIQLHPYMVESERYRNTLRARGIRPVQVATNSQNPRQGAEDTQDLGFRSQDTQSQSQSQSHTLTSTPPDSSGASQSQAAVPSLQHAMSLDQFVDAGDEFPDLDTLLQRHVAGGVQQGHKRRKTIDTPDSRDRSRHFPSSTSGTRGKLKYIKSRPYGSLNALINGMPPSPPTTSSPSNLDPLSAMMPRFRVPRGATPTLTETPVALSPYKRTEVSSVRRPHLVEPLSSASDDDQGDDESENSSPWSSDADERQLRRMQKRIKGVLPASWLKLDRKGQRKPLPLAPNGVQYEPSPQQPAPLKGVAQRRIPSASSTPAPRRHTLIISDESDESDNSRRALQMSKVIRTQHRQPEQRLLKPFDDDFDDEVVEHDEIDGMLPATSRHRIKKSKSLKRQSRLTDDFLQPIDAPNQSRRMHSAGQASTVDPSQKTGSRGKVATKRKAKRPRVPRLSILDAPQGQAQASSARRPRFLSLAARQARNRHDCGRHSPTHKIVRLATREDTHDALAPLRSWQAGDISNSWRTEARERNLERQSGDAKVSTPVADHGKSRPPQGMADFSEDGRVLSDQESLVDSLPNKKAVAGRKGAGNAVRQTGQLHPPQVRNLTASGPRTHSHRQVQRTYQPRKVQVKPRGMLERHNQLRPAQLEGVATHSRNDYDMLTFAPPPSRLMEIFNRDRVAKPAELRLERFLQDRGDCPVDHGHAGRSEGHHSPAEELPDSNGRPPIKRRLKQRARRFDVQLATYRQPSEPLPTEITFNTLNDNLVEENAKLLGLGPLGTRYPTDFDIRPLEIGTYFHQSTFIGSGDFQDSLNLRDRDLDAIAGRITIDVQGKSLEWSAWDEEVSAGLTTILSTCTTAFRALSSAINQQDREVMFMESATLLRYHLRSLVRYCSGCLYFFDPVDRSPCVARISRFLNEFTEMLDDRIPELRQHSLPSSEVDNLAVDSFLYLLVMSSQALKIAQHSSVESTVREALVDKIRRLSRKAIDLAFPGIFSTLRSFYERQTQHVIRDAGIRDDETAAKTVVMVNQILKVRWIGTSLSDILADRQRHTVNKSCNVQNFDQVWYDVFTIQPLLEIDAHGIFRPGSRFQTSNDNWDLIKCLLHRLFQLYPASSQPTNASVNDYVRACLARGYVLMARWGWHMCETLLSTVYDFFARNNLAQLPKEEGRGSVQFLNELDKDPTVQVDTGDCAFHIFLKSLVVGLQGMQNIYPERKVRGFAWRFIPNHGRTYRKDQDITQTSLDALRNHHDLLCTLYWVLPAGSGPRLEMIKDLVNHTTSHREACQISVHAWGMIAKYQMSREQEFKDLHSLGDWFKEMVTSTISQYRLARSEAETQYASEMAKGTSDLSQEVLDTTIASNQRSIVGTLLDLLQVLQQAVRVAKNPETVCKLVNLSGSVEVFKLFDPDQTRLLAAVTNSLDIFKEMFDVISRTSLSQRTDSQQGSEESQDYGEWEHLDEAIDHVETPRAASVPLPTSFLYEPLAALLSSCFGAEKSPNDDVLTKVIDVWVEMARRSVKSGVQDWSAYLDTYSTASWFQLRKTEQKRKLTPYFLSSVVEADPTSLNNHRSLFLGAWLVSLLDRESMLKYQHKLTMSLLNNSVSDPLLHNLPFASNPRTGLFSITLADFRSRRLSLLGTIFSNMRRPVESSAPGLVSETRRAYNTMLRQAQSSMRETYQELQTVSANAQSSYVAFVQAVVSLLQQHTLDICAIDPFFVDSSAFPLPANDPAYVVGRLKSYVSKLEDARARKQLAVFVQTVGERAAVDGLQGYLVSQLHDALGGAGSKLLRQVLLTAILPAYVEASTTTSSGWILAVPLVKAAGLVLADLVYEVDPADHTALQLHVSSIRAVLAVLLQLLQRLADDAADAGIAQPHHLRLLAAAFDTAKASLTTVDWIRQSTELGEQTAAIIRGFVTLGEWFWDVLVVAAPPPSFPEAQEDDDADARDAIEHTAAARPALAANGVVDLANPAATATTLPYRDTLAFSRKNLLDDLNRCWVRKTDTNTNGSRNRNDDDEGEDDDDDDEGEGSRDAYYVSRGGSVAREVVVDIGLAEEERARARTAIRGFMVGYDVVFRRRGVLRDGGCG